MPMDVTLKAHTAEVPGHPGRMKNLGQCLVFANGKQVAIYCGAEKKPAIADKAAEYEKGKYLSFIGTIFEFSTSQGLVFEDVIKEVTETITKLTGEKPCQVDWPPPPWGDEGLDPYASLSSETIIGADLGGTG